MKSAVSCTSSIKDVNFLPGYIVNGVVRTKNENLKCDLFVVKQVGLSVVRYSLYGQYKGRDRDRRQGASSSRSLQRRESRKTLSVDARPFYMTGEGTSNEHLPSNMLQLGEALFPKVQGLRPVS